MSTIAFIVFAAISTAIAYALIQFCIVFPAWKRHRIQQATTSLSRCLNALNADALPNAKIRNGHYLHDRFYRLLFSVFRCDAPIIKSTAKMTYDKKVETDMKRFRDEIDNLDDDTKAIIDEALSAITLLVFLHNPIKFFVCVVKSIMRQNAFKNQSLKKKMVRGGEYLTVNDRISFDMHCHA
jgi:hypothetical protein